VPAALDVRGPLAGGGDVVVAKHGVVRRVRDMNVEAETHAVHFDGERWSHHLEQAEDDVAIETSPEALAALATTSSAERDCIFKEIRLPGEPDRLAEFQAVLGAMER
jgi:hypothetical protein